MIMEGGGGPKNFSDDISDDDSLQDREIDPSQSKLVKLEISRLPLANLGSKSDDFSFTMLKGPVPTINEPLKPPRHRLYQDNSVGPWVVYFRPKPNGKRLNLINIARDLKNGFTSVSLIEKVSPNKMRATVGSLKEANAIVRSKKFTIEYRVYIPARDVEIDGKVTEEGLTASELLDNGVGRFKDPALPPVRILDVFQLQTGNGEGEKKAYSPSNSWRVTFAGTALPDYVTIGLLRLPVKLFVPRVMNCSNCFRLGHTATYCENKARCNKCGEHHDGGTCTSQTEDQKCLYCGGSPHLKLSECPRYKLRSEKIKSSIKQSSQRSYKDILMNSLPIGQGNRFDLLSEDDSESVEYECFEGTSSGPLKSPPRKRRTTSKNKPGNNAKINSIRPQSEGKIAKSRKSPPGNKPDPLEYPPLESLIPRGTLQSKPEVSKNTNSSMKSSKDQFVGNKPDSGSYLSLPIPSDDGKFRLSNLLDLFFDFLDFPESWKRIVKLFLPKIGSFLKQKSLTCPLIAEFISFDE